MEADFTQELIDIHRKDIEKDEKRIAISQNAVYRRLLQARIIRKLSQILQLQNTLVMRNG